MLRHATRASTHTWLDTPDACVNTQDRLIFRYALHTQKRFELRVRRAARVYRHNAPRKYKDTPTPPCKSRSLRLPLSCAATCALTCAQATRVSTASCRPRRSSRPAVLALAALAAARTAAAAKTAAAVVTAAAAMAAAAVMAPRRQWLRGGEVSASPRAPSKKLLRPRQHTTMSLSSCTEIQGGWVWA